MPGLAVYDPNKIINSLPTVDDSMANQVTALSSKDSAINQMAKTEGLKAANRRGLLNSSMAVGSAQDAVLKNIMPIASQDAATAAAKNAAARAFEYGLTGQEHGQRFQTSEREATQGYQTGEREAGQEFITGERLGAQEYGTFERLGSQAFQTLERLGSQEFAGTQNDLNRELQSLLAANAITSAEKMGFAQIASTEGMAAAGRALQASLAEKEIQFRMTEGNLNRAQATEQFNAEMAFNTQQNQLSRDLNKWIAETNLKGTQQAGLSDAAKAAQGWYQAEYQSIMANDNLTADQRTTMLAGAANRFNNSLGLAEQVYNTNLQWGPAAAPAAAAPAAAAPAAAAPAATRPATTSTAPRITTTTPMQRLTTLRTSNVRSPSSN